MKKLALILIFASGIKYVQAQINPAYDYNLYQQIHINSAPEEMISILLQGDVQLIKSKLIALQGVVKIESGDIVSVLVPQKNIAKLLESNFIKRAESKPARMVALNDTMRYRHNIQEIHDGIAPLAQPYKGAGVVRGFIDTGIDPSHPDFKNANGTSRIAWIWDHSKPNAPNTPMPYNYGQEWNAAAIDAGQCQHVDPPQHYGHGTLSAGITSGNGLATGFNQGVAPESDIIMVAYDFNTTQPNRIADAVDYIFNKAAQMGKPCVINASLGDYYGSHDGRDLEAILIDNLILAQSGRALVAAAGNLGNDSLHLETTVTSDTTWTWFKYDPALSLTYIELWADTADFNNVQFAIGVDSITTSPSFIGHTPFKKINSTLGIPTNYTIPGLPGDAIQYYGSVSAGRYQLLIQITSSHPTYLWRLMTTGSGKFDVWHLLFTNFKSGMVKENLPPASVVPEIVNYVMPDRMKNVVNSYGCSDQVITVANVLNRNSNIDCSDTLRFNSVDIPGTLANNSGTGPTRDNRQKPEIAASGNYIMAPIVLYMDTASALTNKKVNKGCYHKVAGGTSAAAPVVAGIAALYFQENQAATNYDFKQALICSAKQDAFTGTSLPDYYWGYGKADGYHTLIGCFTNINEIESGISVSVFPNPFSDQCAITAYYKNGIPQNLNLRVFDVSGRLILEANKSDFEVAATNATIQLSKFSLSAGMYFYEVTADSPKGKKGKLIAE